MEALSARWGWRYEDGGKTVFAVSPGRFDRSSPASRTCRCCTTSTPATSPFVKLARILRGKSESGQYRRGDILPAADLAGQYTVSVRVTRNTLAMLAANRYVSRPGSFRSYSVIWQAGA